MKFQVVTLFPKMIEAFTLEGVVGQARQKQLIQVETISPRLQTQDLHKTVDDRPYGGGDGMVMLAEPLQKTLEKIVINEPDSWIVYLTPQGMPLDHELVQKLSDKKNLVLICGRYGGVDQRVLNQFVDQEISIGDYVLSGGELAAGVIIDAVSRLVPGVLGHADSAISDSFSDKLMGLLEAPSFTRPQEFLGEKVPAILLSGNHAKIEKWRGQISKLVTLLKRPDLSLQKTWSNAEIRELQKFWKELGESDREVLGLSALSDTDLELLSYDELEQRL
ncbi:MAG: tRNA (guanosine(37)-N1)-methyltransferase TrmD [Pseudobdellovibrionaceae bacterium]